VSDITAMQTIPAIETIPAFENRILYKIDSEYVENTLVIAESLQLEQPK
jgi:hypothetical protein